jgi:hypothetical protein
MKNEDYQKYFKINHWGTIPKEIITKLKRESVVITCLPGGGKRYLLKHMRSYYTDFTNDHKTIIPYIEIIPQRTTISHILPHLLQEIKFSTGYPKYLEDLTCEEAVRELILRGKKIVIMINHLERLLETPESIAFLDSFKTIDQFNIRYVFGCDISCVLNPELYRQAPSITSSNIICIPPFDLNGVKRVIKVNRILYKLDCSLSWSNKIYELSGGNPGLIKYLIKYISEEKPKILKLNKLIKNPGLRVKLINIVDTLSKYKLIDSRNSIMPSKTNILMDLGMLNSRGNLKIKLLNPFLMKPQAKVDTNLKKLLSAQELSLFRIFEKSQEKIIDLDKISKSLWGKDAEAKYSLWAIYKTISNMNKKLKTVGKKIENFRGRGYALVNKRKK